MFLEAMFKFLDVMVLFLEDLQKEVSVVSVRLSLHVRPTVLAKI